MYKRQGVTSADVCIQISSGWGVGNDLGFDDVTISANVVPVSYTHLRAHETVLDLVCRLLLEKKKTNWSTSAE